MIVELTQILSVAGIMISAGSLIVAYFRVSREEMRSSKKHMVDLEHRLTVCEQHQFTDEDEQRLVTLQECVKNNMFSDVDRKCLNEVHLKMTLFWSVVEKEFPKIIRQEKTPVLDMLLDKAAKIGIMKLNEKDYKKLIALLQREYNKAIAVEDTGRAMAIAFYQSIVQYPKKEKDQIC